MSTSKYATKITFVDELPPVPSKKGQYTTHNERVRDELRKTPGKWALFLEGPMEASNSLRAMAQTFKRSNLGNDFETAVRTFDQRVHVYARYNPVS